MVRMADAIFEARYRSWTALRRDLTEQIRIGGLLLAQFGRVPEYGDIVTLGDRFEFRVIKANNRRIITLEMNVLD